MGLSGRLLFRRLFSTSHHHARLRVILIDAVHAAFFVRRLVSLHRRLQRLYFQKIVGTCLIACRLSLNSKRRVWCEGGGNCRFTNRCLAQDNLFD